jgi:D-alanyl-D-alanine carboxypeptidase
MMAKHGHSVAVALVVALASCAQTDGTETAASGERPAARVTSASPSGRATAFPTEAFADISEDPVSEKVALEFQAILNDMAGGGGMAATVMSADGTWSGAAGKADGVRDVRVDDQFAIGSVTKPLIAAQVMQMVEAGELALDDPATDLLPPTLDFDTNEATILDLLSHRSGIPDYWDEPEVQKSLRTDQQRRWKPAELLNLVPKDHAPAGGAFEYGDTNYLLLGLVIEQVRGRPVAEVLRDGVLNIDEVDRLIYQPDEKPTEPMAMPGGRSTAVLEKGGGYLPSLAGSTSDTAAAAIASDAPSLARWWWAFCAGEIVSQDSLNEMSTLIEDEYGLGLFTVADPYPQSIGHTGQHVGYVAWAGCMPEDGSVVVALNNHLFEDIGGMALPLVAAVSSE